MKYFDHIFIVTNDLTHDRRVRRLISVLTDHNQSVLLVGRKLPDSKPLTNEIHEQTRVSCFFNRGMLFYAEFVIRVVMLTFRNYRANHITCNDIDTILVGAILKRVLQFELHLDCHEWFEEVPELRDSRLKKKIWELITRIGLKSTDQRYTVNPQIAEQLNQKYNYKFEVIRNIEPLSRSVDWNAKLPIETLNIVYLGVLNEGRGLELMIQCMPNLEQAKLHIIGEGDISIVLKQMIEMSPAKDRICLHGMLSPHEFGPILESSHVGINLLRADSKSYYYSSANKVYDYLNHGLIVVTMAYPVYQQMAKETDMIKLIEKLDKAQLISMIRQIHQNYEPEHLQKEYQEAIQKFSWNNEKPKVIQLYQLD